MDVKSRTTNIPSLEIVATIERMQAISRQRDTHEIIQLPGWSDFKRGTPNSFLRSALFSAIQSKDRVYIDGKLLSSQAGTTIKFTGQQLNQEDLTLWETLVHMAKAHPLGNVCSFSAHSILKAMDFTPGGSQHERLHKGIIRLTACAVEITHEGKLYFGSLINSGVTDELNNQYTVELNRDLIRLYGETQWTAIDWEQRMKLRRKPLAQALHAYYSSHRVPYPVKLATLQNLTGSRIEQAAGFKRLCRTALDELIAIGFLQEHRFLGDTVTVQRMPIIPKSI